MNIPGSSQDRKEIVPSFQNVPPDTITPIQFLKMGCSAFVSNLSNMARDIISGPSAPGSITALSQDIIRHKLLVRPFAERVSFLENSKDKLINKITACKGNAGIGDALAPWNQEVVKFSREVGSNFEIGGSTLPSLASAKSADASDPVAETDKVLAQFIDKFSTWTILVTIHELEGPKTGVTYTDLSSIVGKTSSPKDALDRYIELCKEKTGWDKTFYGSFRTWCMNQAYPVLSRHIPRIIEKAFKGVIKEIRKSTDEDGKIKKVFEGLMEYLESFLKEYSSQVNAAGGQAPTQEPSIEDLCKGLSPYLISEFIDKINLCKEGFKGNWTRFGNPFWLGRGVVDPTLDQIIRIGLLEPRLPGWLKTAANGLENSITGKSDGNVATAGSAINYGLTNPILNFINAKLSDFLVILDAPKRETEDPVPEELKEKLGGVVKELMALAKDKLSGNVTTQDGLRDGLIDGAYLLLKFWQGQQEVLLKSILELTVNSLYPTGDSDPSTLASEELKHKQLLEDQREIVGKISSKIIDVKVKEMAVGSPSSQVNYHWFSQYSKIRSYLEEGLADTIGIKRAFKEDDLDTVLNKHWVFWEGFIALMKEATKKHYPEQAREMLMKEFYSLCEFASEQMDLIRHLQEEKRLCSNHEKLRKLFVKEYFELMEKRVDGTHRAKDPEAINIQNMHALLKEMAVLFPSGNDRPRELIVLETYIGKLEGLRSMEREIATLQIRIGSLNQGAKDQIDNLCLELALASKRLRIEQLKLLRTIKPELSSEEFKSPMAFGGLLENLGGWLQEKANGYDRLHKQNLERFRLEVSKLPAQNTKLLARVRAMKPEKLHNVLEERYDEAEKWPAEGFSYKVGRAAINYFAKAPLQKDFDAVLGAVRCLINAEKTDVQSSSEAPRKKNLYVAAERKLLEEVLRYYKTRPAQE